MNPTVIVALGIVALAVLGAIAVVLTAVRRGYGVIPPKPPARPVAAQAAASTVAAVPDRRSA